MPFTVDTDLAEADTLTGFDMRWYVTKQAGQYRVAADIGGTFTDVYAEIPGEASFRVVKLLSENPENWENGTLSYN